MLDFNIYPEGLELIQKSGIEDRVNRLKASKDGLPYIGGHVSSGEIIDSVNYVKEKGYYNNIPDSISKQYKESMNKMLNNPEEFFWTVDKTAKTVKEKVDLEQMLLFTGEMAAFVLSPEELWDNEKFGFDSPLGMISTIGAYVINRSRDTGSDYRQGYRWTRKRDDGSEILTEITGDHNADLRIYQTDIASYPTIDPFGNKILFRPKMRDDFDVVAAYHSTEPYLFSAVLQYIEQEKITSKELSELLSDDAKGLIDYAKSIEFRGRTAEVISDYFNSMLHFTSWVVPIPRLDANDNTEERASNHLSMFSEGWYDIFIASNNDLVISRYYKDSPANPKMINARFMPDDASHLLKGLMYQCARGLGRSDVYQLIDMLNYRFSGKFDEDMGRYKTN